MKSAIDVFVRNVDEICDFVILVHLGLQRVPNFLSRCQVSGITLYQNLVNNNVPNTDRSGRCLFDQDIGLPISRRRNGATAGIGQPDSPQHQRKTGKCGIFGIRRSSPSTPRETDALKWKDTEVYRNWSVIGGFSPAMLWHSPDGIGIRTIGTYWS
jgi:hypothetical protein